MRDLQKTDQISRRQFLKYSAVLSASVAGPIFFQGCAVDPVTGKKQLMLVYQQQEIGIDKKQSPFQFSADYGITQNKRLNQYVSGVGKGLLPYVHRPGMPYNFQCVNATYINAYAFPGGSIAVTRGILLKLENEAELASLLGHELGHVNARHTAEQVSKGQLSSLLVGGLSMAASSKSSGLGQLTQQLGMLSQSLLLSKYSRDNEREADFLGNEYMVKAGYSSQGFVGLMEVLDSLHKQKPSSVQVLFSTHPMSHERLFAAVQRQKGQYNYTGKYPLNRDRYMDNIASLRKKRQSIELLQVGETYFAKKEYGNAESAFKKSIKSSKNDYTAHVLLSKCLMLRKKTAQALSYAQKAKKLYPSETQGHYICGMANSKLKKFGRAYSNFNRCDILLPGNPQVKFFKGYCLDKNGDRDPAAKDYMAYLKMINYQPNQYSKYAYNRLKEWGYAN
jgi:predicted Zn-dependent protease